MAVDLITIGRVVKPHGIDGTLKVFPLTDFPQHFQSLKVVFLIKDGTTEVSVEEARLHKGHVLLKLRQCTDRSCAEKWTGAEIAIDSNELWPLKDGEYYQFQIEGLHVITEEGESLGEVAEIIPTGSNDVYVIRKGEREYLLPAIKEVIKSVDLEKKEIIVHLLEGLID
ncbi:MAG: ribosome maturation factor RimM [bacterium]